MCFRQITRCDPAILSITLLHDEDMPPFDTHGKKRVDMIVQMDAVGCKKASGESLTHLRRRDQSSAPTRFDGPIQQSHHVDKSRAYTVTPNERWNGQSHRHGRHTRTGIAGETKRREQNFGMNSGETDSAGK
jgi:hypothetical protein